MVDRLGIELEAKALLPKTFTHILTNKSVVQDIEEICSDKMCTARHEKLKFIVMEHHR